MSVETYDYVEHTAIVQSTDPVRNIVNVRITDLEECGDCPAAQLCNAAGSESNIIAIITPHASGFRKGDILEIRGTEQMHRKAIMYATVLPCIALVDVMVAVYLLTLNQLAAALSGIGVMILFFFILWCSRNKIAHEFCFTIVGKPERQHVK